MKPILKCFFLAVLVFAMACSSRKSEYEIPPLVIEIPVELDNQPEVVMFIRSFVKTINRYAGIIERAYFENPDLWEKEAEEMTMVEKLKALRLSGEMTVAFNDFSVKYAIMNEKMSEFEMQMADGQAYALATVGEIFEKRMKLLEQRIEKISVK